MEYLHIGIIYQPRAS